MKILIVATNGWSLINFRGELIKEWIKRGNEVTCISIEHEEDMHDQIKELGASYYRVPGNRTGTNIFMDFKMLILYNKAFRQIQPDICFLYMSKPIAYGGLAAIHCKIRRIFVFVTGLEIAFYSKGIKNAIVRFILKTLFRIVHKESEHIFFMNKYDYSQMLNWGLTTPEKSTIVGGSGVDMTYYTRKPMPDEDIVLMTARLVWSKGIREYIEAAKIVKRKYPHVRFLLVGGLDDNPEALTRKELNELVEADIIEYCGYAEDVRPYLERCSIFVLPSYHEGKGRSILEAEAVGRPIITTDAPGCSETVINGYNGFLVPVKDGKSIADKIEILIKDKDLQLTMSENSYKFCKQEFDVKKVNREFIKKMGMLDNESNKIM